MVGAFTVQKVLDAADVQAERDMSGFEFEVTTGPNTTLGRLTTGIDGRTPPIEATAGTYSISEVGRPGWATVLVDGGPITFEFEPGHADEVREIAYTNIVPAVALTTAAHDASDGDRMIDLAGGNATVIDTVTYTGLVPGTEYTVAGELMVRPTTTAADDEEVIATGITGTATFSPSEPDGSVDVVFTVPADSPLVGHDAVVYQRLAVTASTRIVATHTDPTAAEQTIRFAEVVAPNVPTTTTIPPITATPSTAIATTGPATRTPVTTTPVTPPPTITPPPSLPRTGNDGTRQIMLIGLTLFLLGCSVALTARRLDTEIDDRPGSTPSTE